MLLAPSCSTLSESLSVVTHQMSQAIRRSSLSRGNAFYGYIRSRQNSPGDLLFEVHGGDITPLDDPTVGATAALSPGTIPAEMRRASTCHEPAQSPTAGLFRDLSSSPMRRSTSSQSSSCTPSPSPTCSSFRESLRSPARDRFASHPASLLLIPRYNPDRAEEYKHAHQQVFRGAFAKQAGPPPQGPLPKTPLQRTPADRERQGSATSQPSLASNVSSPVHCEEVITPDARDQIEHIGWRKPDYMLWAKATLPVPGAPAASTLQPSSAVATKKRRPRPTPLCLASSSFDSVRQMGSGSGSSYTGSSASLSSSSHHRLSTSSLALQRSAARSSASMSLTSGQGSFYARARSPSSPLSRMFVMSDETMR